MPLSRYHKTRNKYIRGFLNQLLSKLTIVIILVNYNILFSKRMDNTQFIDNS